MRYMIYEDKTGRLCSLILFIHLEISEDYLNTVKILTSQIFMLVIQLHREFPKSLLHKSSYIHTYNLLGYV